MRIVALAGGVGGAKLVDGLAQVLPPQDLTVVVNTGDDLYHFGLKICPDVDTVCYTLAGLANPGVGWGRDNETWQAIQSVKDLGGPTWFNLGDRDLGTHLERTRRLQVGEPLSQIIRAFCIAWGVKVSVLPMSDQTVATQVITLSEGELPFQEYFVHRQCLPEVKGFRFAGIDQALPAPGVKEALQDADVVVFCPSNPWVSIDPILCVPGLCEMVAARPVVAVSPLIQGQAVKGPAAKMYRELGIEPSALAVAQHYRGLLSGFILDRSDQQQVEEISRWGIISLATDIMMPTVGERQRLAVEVLDFCKKIIAQRSKII
jgi:LPPG:FO 2-phospho-L-lactate transferase